MKNWINKSFLFLMASLVLMSCEKDEDMTILRVGDAPVVSASVTDLALTQEEEGSAAITFKWSPADYGYQAAVNYSIQYDVAGNEFAGAKEVAVANLTEKTFTVNEFNALAAKLKLPVGMASDMELRVKADISSEVTPLYSQPITVSVVPYLDIIEYTSLYVPGLYQGWTPGSAPKVSSLQDNGVFEGYVYMNTIAEGFKFTSQPNWDGPNYGAGATAGTLSDDGGASNLTVSEPGFYLLKVDVNKLTWSATKTNWAVTGNATPKGWVSDSVTDHDMTYDEERGVWAITLPLTAGAIKFRANDAWGLNYGDNKPADGFVDQGSEDNIVVEEAGTYEIVLDLSIPGYYSYTLTKQ
ncbi:SusE domain-containing protein [Pontibacter rugosus]|uniref:SusE domain-containing protein n=1 Tax=Pontibacter rugosus TaxID=1745966 RepID=A0ABW3SKQ9_9BACT